MNNLIRQYRAAALITAILHVAAVLWINSSAVHPHAMGDFCDGCGGCGWLDDWKPLHLGDDDWTRARNTNSDVDITDTILGPEGDFPARASNDLMCDHLCPIGWDPFEVKDPACPQIWGIQKIDIEMEAMTMKPSPLSHAIIAQMWNIALHHKRPGMNAVKRHTTRMAWLGARR